MQALADTVGKPLSVVQDRVAQLQEVNPMLGFRGCRLSVVYPEITEMQARAVASAAAANKKVLGLGAGRVQWWDGLDWRGGVCCLRRRTRCSRPDWLGGSVRARAGGAGVLNVCLPPWCDH